MTRDYYEPGRGYRSAWLLTALLGALWLLDAALGGGAVHAVAWIGALVVVVGADLLTIRAARAVRSITVTDTAIRVGDAELPRERVVAVLDEAPPDARPLGRARAGVAVRLTDGSAVLLPSRRPDRLVAALTLPRELPGIRLAGADDLAALDDIERRAGALFTVAGIGPFPEHVREPGALAVLVAGRPPVGFAHVDELAGQAHLEQLSVLPSHMRRGIGGALLEAACAWAGEHGYDRITLCTYADVPWNAPFYARHGFTVLDDLPPELARLRTHERELGLDAFGPRVVMLRRLRDSTP